MAKEGKSIELAKRENHWYVRAAALQLARALPIQAHGYLHRGSECSKSVDVMPAASRRVESHQVQIGFCIRASDGNWHNRRRPRNKADRSIVLVYPLQLQNVMHCLDMSFMIAWGFEGLAGHCCLWAGKPPVHKIEA
jgi:hypothetical protein